MDTYPPKELEMLLHGEHVKQDVMLRTETQILAHFIQIVTYVVAADSGVATRRLQET